MVASGQVVSYETTVVDVDGESSQCMVTRIGLFNAVCDGKYLEYAAASGQYAFLPRQPAGRYTKLLKTLAMLKLENNKIWGRSDWPNRRKFIS